QLSRGRRTRRRRFSAAREPALTVHPQAARFFPEQHAQCRGHARGRTEPAAERDAGGRDVPRGPALRARASPEGELRGKLMLDALLRSRPHRDAREAARAGKVRCDAPAAREVRKPRLYWSLEKPAAGAAAAAAGAATGR